NPIPKVADNRETPEAVTTMVRHVRETWQEVEPYTPEVAQFFYGMLFTLAPEARDFFPIHMDVRSGKLVRAIVNILQSVDRPDDVAPYLVQLGRDHRKFGVQPHHYEAIGTALLAAVKRQLQEAWTPEVERAWAEAFTIVARSMQDAAEADEYPPSWTGTVAEHRRLSWDLAL